MLGTPIPVQRPLVVKKRRAPKTYPCPVCGKPGRRKCTNRYVAHHLAHRRACEWHVTVGVYRATCNCERIVRRKEDGRRIEVRKPIKTFTASIPGLEAGQKYTDAVREKIVDLVVRDRLSNMQTLEHMREEHCLDISEGFIYLCLAWAQEKGALLKPTAPGAWRISLASCA